MRTSSFPMLSWRRTDGHTLERSRSCARVIRPIVSKLGAAVFPRSGNGELARLNCLFTSGVLPAPYQQERDHLVLPFHSYRSAGPTPVVTEDLYVSRGASRTLPGTLLVPI